jgi:N-formylmaleamate deformylase
MSNFMYGAHVHANGIRQHYLRYGAPAAGRQRREALIVVPGITSPAATWGFVGERLGQHFDTYILDVRGRGLSESSGQLDVSLDAQAQDVLALAAALGLERFAIMGHSMGARIAVRAARSRPPGLTRLVLADPPVSGPGRRPYPAKLAWYLDSMRAARAGMGIEAMREFCPSWTDDQLRLRCEWLHTCDERAIIASFEGFQSDDIHADLPLLAVPVLLMVAGRGDVVLPADIAEIRTLLPSVEVAHVPGAGHMIPWDDEAGFYLALADFLDLPGAQP